MVDRQSEYCLLQGSLKANSLLLTVGQNRKGIKGIMNYKDDDEIISIFKEETAEHLVEIENGVLKLENNQGTIDKELVHSMFRSAHSIKAGANLLEFKNIEKLAHSLEDILQKLLSGELRMDGKSVTVFLQGIDTIRELMENLQFSELVNVSSTVNKLAEYSKY